MGFSNSTVIGAFCKITLPTVDETVTKTIKTCPKDGCVKHGKEMTLPKFCPECGTPIETITKTEIMNQQFDIHDFLYDLEDKELSANDVDLGIDYFRLIYEYTSGLKDNQMYLIPNFDIDHSIDIEENDFFDLSQYNSQTQIASFKEAHKLMLWELGEAIGHENLEIGCGVIAYSH